MKILNKRKDPCLFKTFSKQVQIYLLMTGLRGTGDGIGRGKKSLSAGDGGHLLINDDKGVLSGYSIVELPLKANKSGYKRMLTFSPLSGKSKLTENGKTEFSFKVDAAKGYKTISKGFYDPKEELMSAKSESEVPMGSFGRVTVKKTSIDYNWQAK